MPPMMIEMTAEERINELYNEAAKENLPMSARQGLVVAALTLQRENNDNLGNILFVPSLRNSSETESSSAASPDDPLSNALNLVNSNSPCTQPLTVVLSAVKDIFHTQSLGTIEELLANCTHGWIPGVLMSRPMRKIWATYWREPAQAAANIGIINSLIREINLAYNQSGDDNTIPLEVIELVDGSLRASREYAVEHGDQELLLLNLEAEDEIRAYQRKGILPYLDIQLHTEDPEQSRQGLAAQRQLYEDNLAEIGDAPPGYADPPGYSNPFANEYTRFTPTFSIAWAHENFVPRAREICEDINHDIIEANIQRQIEAERGYIDFDELENHWRRGRELRSGNLEEEEEEVDAFCSHFRRFCRERQYPGGWASIVRRSFRDQSISSPDTAEIDPSRQTTPSRQTIPSRQTGPSRQIRVNTPTSPPTPGTTILESDHFSNRGDQFPDQNGATTGGETAASPMEVRPQPPGLIVAAPAPGYTARGHRILAYLGDRRRQCIVDEGNDDQYVLRGQSEIGGFEVVDAAIKLAGIPQLGKIDRTLLAQRQTLIFSRVLKTAVAPSRTRRRNLPVSFLLVQWENHETCWVSRTILARLAGRNSVGRFEPTGS